MSASLTRRACLAGGLVAVSAGRLPVVAAEEPISERLSALEQRHGGRLGVAILDTGSSELVVHRGDERFPLCSTYKVLAAAFTLARVDRGQESLERRVSYSREALVTYSPITERHAGSGGMTVAALCDAAVTLSDNTAGNLLLEACGGPDGLTAYFRSLGDDVTRMDRYETALNSAQPGDPRDTTTPIAMMRLLQRLVVSADTLSKHSRDLLVSWMVGCKTGNERLRGGVPADWTAGDKTGSGETNTANDVAIVWPPKRHPIIVTAFYTGSQAASKERNAVLMEVGRQASSI